MSILVQFISIGILLILSACLSASETALFSLSKFQLRRISLKHPIRGNAVLNLLKTPRRTLITILVANLMVNILVSSMVSSIAISKFGYLGIGIAIGVMTFTILVFGEVTPKLFALRKAESLSLTVAVPLQYLSIGLAPARKILHIITDFFMSMIGKAKVSPEPFITEDELKSLVSIGEKEGVIDTGEKRMIHEVFELQDRAVDEIMTPRVDIIACRKNASSNELIEFMKASNHTKIPIFEDNIDKIIGVVYTKEFMLNKPDIKEILVQNKEVAQQRFIKPVLFVPETKKIAELLKELQEKRMDLSVVVDEYGGTAGLVTLEDILEEIVGEIQDEHDKEEQTLERVDSNEIKVGAKISIRDVNEILSLNLPTGESETIGGLVLELFGRIPKSGECIEYKCIKFTVEEVKRNRIHKVLISRSRK